MGGSLQPPSPAAPLTLCLPPARLVPAVPAPGRDGPRKTRSTPERTLVLELVRWGGWGGVWPRGWGLTLLPTLQEGTLVCSSMLAGWRQGATAAFTTVFQGDSYKVGAHVLGLGQRGAGSLGGHRGL